MSGIIPLQDIDSLELFRRRKWMVIKKAGEI